MSATRKGEPRDAAQKSVSLSYRRRVGWQSARLAFSHLREHGYDVFWDVESLAGGEFPPIIQHQIEARPHFIVVLNPGSLQRIADPRDWLRREIEHAVRHGRNVVPLLFDRFTFDGEEYAAEESTEQPAPADTPAGQTVTAARGGYELVRIPGGKFTMGSPQTDDWSFDDERPQHEVEVAPFELGVRPVTNEEYGRYLEANSDAPGPEYWSNREFNQPDQPVVGVSWDEAKAYCDWAGLVLPSEAQWEYACRARTRDGTTTRFCSGDTEEDLKRVGWYDESSGGRTHPVGQKEPNAWGLYDVHGNVWEWCEDKWHGSYKGAPKDGSAWVTGGSGNRVLRGGSWDSSARYCRSAYRDWYYPVDRGVGVGFRPARSVTE